MKAVLIVAVLILAACVPVKQPQQYRVVHFETKAGLSDLAGAFSIGDEYHDESEYMDLITKIYDCSYGAEVWEWEYTDQQAMAASIWSISLAMTFAAMAREEEFEAGLIDQYHEEGFEDAGDRTMYQMLLWATEHCE